MGDQPLFSTTGGTRSNTQFHADDSITACAFRCDRPKPPGATSAAPCVLYACHYRLVNGHIGAIYRSGGISLNPIARAYLTAPVDKLVSGCPIELGQFLDPLFPGVATSDRQRDWSRLRVAALAFPGEIRFRIVAFSCHERISRFHAVAPGRLKRLPY